MRAVFVAGMGAVTPFGDGVPLLIDSIFSGRSALRVYGRLSDAPRRIGVTAELPLAALDAAGGVAGLAFHSARIASLEALNSTVMHHRRDIGMVLSTTKADMSGIFGGHTGPAAASDYGLGSPARLGVRLADALKITGPCIAVSNACASGLSAIAVAARWIAHGRADRVLVVGVDILNDFILRGFSSLLAIAPQACRPFDASRVGLSLGEAAGAILLSAESHDACGVRVAGWGGSNDAQHITRPQADGVGVRRAAERALAMAGMTTSTVACVHLHGTGTLLNDAMEANAMVGLFGGNTPPAFGTKAQTGHTLGAAGLIESVIAITALLRGECPANVGLSNSDVDKRLDLIVVTRRLERKPALLKIAAGFGGINAAVVYAR